MTARPAPALPSVHPLADRLALLWALAVGAGLLALFHGHGFDDPYITYRYAANIASGAGFVYNPGVPVLSTTTPLSALLLAGGALVGLPIPLVSNALTCAALALGGWLLWRLGRLWHTPLVGLAGLLLYPTFPLLLNTIGSEMALANALVLLGFWGCATQRYRLAAVVLALAVLTRADALVAVGVAGLYVLWQHGGRWRALPWGALVVFGLVLLPWLAFATWYFGAPFPVTLAAKQQQGLMVINQGFLPGLAEVAGNYWALPGYRLYALFALVGLVALWRAPQWGLLLGWNALYAAAYTLLGVPDYIWYYAPLVIGLALLVGLGVALLADWARCKLGPRWSAALAALLLLALLTPQLAALAARYAQPDPRLALYREVGLWLAATTPPDAPVGTLEVGIIGYYAQRPIIDFAGLIQPATAAQLPASGTYDEAAVAALPRFQPTAVVLHEGHFPRLTADTLFQEHCVQQRVFAHPSFHVPLVAYRCTW